MKREKEGKAYTYIYKTCVSMGTVGVFIFMIQKRHVKTGNKERNDWRLGNVYLIFLSASKRRARSSKSRSPPDPPPPPPLFPEPPPPLPGLLMKVVGGSGKESSERTNLRVILNSRKLTREVFVRFTEGLWWSSRMVWRESRWVDERVLELGK